MVKVFTNGRVVISIEEASSMINVRDRERCTGKTDPTTKDSGSKACRMGKVN